MVTPFQKSPEALVRREAASALGQMQAKVDYASMIAAESDGTVRAELYTSLGRILPAIAGAEDVLVKGLSDGHIDALVVQDPVNMGYLGVKTMVDHLQGRPVEKRIDTGAQFITRDRMSDPAVKELLQPDLSRWLKP